MFVNEKTEKDLSKKELMLLKQEKIDPLPEVKELMIKYEKLKIMHQKEHNMRKEKETKLETA